jgi:hypothetical protein
MSSVWKTLLALFATGAAFALLRAVLDARAEPVAVGPAPARDAA